MHLWARWNTIITNLKKQEHQDPPDPRCKYRTTQQCDHVAVHCLDISTVMCMYTVNNVWNVCRVRGTNICVYMHTLVYAGTQSLLFAFCTLAAYLDVGVHVQVSTKSRSKDQAQPTVLSSQWKGSADCSHCSRSSICHLAL